MNRFLSLALLALAASTAWAQGAPAGVFDEYGANSAQMFERDVEPRWRVALGGGIAADPNFQGSDKYRLHPTLFLFAGYGRFFVGFGGVGVNLLRSPGLRAGVIVSLAPGRNESTDARLAGLGDVDRTVQVGLFAVRATRAFVTRGAVYVGGDHHGSMARLDILGRFRAGERVGFFAGPGLTWGSGQYNQTFFGVTSEQSARSGFPEFAANAGINNVRLTAGSSYRFAENWRLFGGVTASRLTGDAAASPITETRAQYRAFLTAIYLFRSRRLATPNGTCPAGTKARAESTWPRWSSK